jgi:hypothetical protein
MTVEVATSCGALKTSVSPTEDRPTPPAHLPTLTALTTGRGIPERVAVLLTTHRVPSLLLNVLGTGIGTPAPSVVTLPHPLLLPPTRHHRKPLAKAITTISVITAPATLPLALRVSLLALSPA